MAPRVPYDPVPKVALQNVDLPKFAPSIPEGAFGETVAQAMGSLGRTIGNVGDEMFKRGIAMQELANDTEAKEAESRYIIKTGELRAKYTTLLGKDAVDGYPAYMEELKRARLEIRDTLSNSAAQRKYDGPSQNTMAYTIYQGAGHSATQQKAWVTQAAAARVEIAQRETLNNPNDEVAFQRSVNDTRVQVESMQAVNGWSDDKTANVATEATSGLWSNRIQGLARKEPFKAKALFDEAVKRRDIQGPDIEKTERVVQTQMYSTGARMISIEVSKEDPEFELSLKERLELGEAKANKLAPDDNMFKDYVRQRIDADWNHRQKIVKDKLDGDIQTVYEGLQGKGGTLPTTVDELLADSKVAAAWNDLPPAKRKPFLDALTKNAKGDVPLTPARVLKFNALRGLAGENPAEFLDVNIMAEDLPHDKRLQLAELQRKVKANYAVDPRVSKAMTQLSPMLGAAGVLQNADDRRQFRGALEDAMDEYAKVYKKPPGTAEINEIGSRLLSEQNNPESRWASIGLTGKERLFRMPVPEKDAEEIKTVIRQQRNREPRAEEVQRIYARKVYQDLFGKATPK